MWLLPWLRRGALAPYSKRGRSFTSMRGAPASGRTRRTSCTGRNIRPRAEKRGAKSVISMALPRSSHWRVTSTAVLGRYCCSLRA